MESGFSRWLEDVRGSGWPRTAPGTGPNPDISLAEAKQKAKLYIPNPTGVSLEDARDLFVKVHCKAKNRPSTAYHTERLLKVHFGISGAWTFPPTRSLRMMSW